MRVNGTVRSVWDGPLPPAHERRVLIHVSDRDPKPDVVTAALDWQQARIGSVFVSVGARHAGSDDEAELVQSLLHMGYLPQQTTFYTPREVRRLPELADIVSELWRRSTDDHLPTPPDDRAPAVAELLAVGATDTFGIPDSLVDAARHTAACLNRLLGSSELPLATAGPASPPTRHPHAVSAPVTPPGPADGPTRRQDARRLLRTGGVQVTLECDQLLSLLCDI
ncbi:hypothetical protein ACH3Y9_33650 [Streptomyces sp. WSLK1-5]|uniref:hypothetical protein n=1 Tax=unclassified Streptomyces TaxID=2593676 RepID=UPI0037A0012E